MKLRVKSTLLSSGKIRAFKLSNKAMQNLRQKLVGANVYLGEPNGTPSHDHEFSQPLHTLQGIIESVDGNDLIINLFKNSEVVAIMEKIDLKTVVDCIGRVENGSISEKL